MKTILRVLYVFLTIGAASTLHAAEISVPETVDVCVYAATPSGLTAAVAAKQEGLSVLIVEPGRFLGGILGAGIKPLQDCPEPRSVGGLTKAKIFRLGNDPPTFRQNCAAWIAQEGIPVLFEHRVVSVQKEGKTIKAIGVEFTSPNENGVPSPTTKKGSEKRITAKMFIDCSYEGDLMKLAGVAYAVGREPRAKFNEEPAGVGPPTNWTPIDPYRIPGDPSSGLLPLVDPDHGKQRGDGDDYTQAYNYRFYVTKDPLKRIPFKKPENDDPARFELVGRFVEYLVKEFGDDEKELKKRLSDIFPGWINSGEYNYKRESLFTIAPLGVSRFYQDGDWTVKSDVWRQHLDYLRGLHHFLSTDSRVPEWFRKSTAEFGLNRTMHEETNGWPHQLYVRITRRMEGRYIVTHQDVLNKKTPEDVVGLALFGVDTYPVRRYVVADPKSGKIGVATEGNMFIGGNRGTGVPYGIPYRAITPKPEQCGNLLVPVCFSATYIAYASARMEPVFCILGESAAVAAAQAIRTDRTVQEIDVPALLKQLSERGQVLQWSPKTELQPPAWLPKGGKNLARNAQATASSTFRNDPKYAPSGANDGVIDIKSHGSRWVSDETAGPHFLELRFEKPQTVDAVRIVNGKADGHGSVHLPINDFVLQYEDAEGNWKDIAATKTVDNENPDFGVLFPAVESSAFRLFISNSEDGVARVWELELYKVAP